jgi:hypothetical protein
MTKNEIKIGNCYIAKVSDKLVSVRIDSTHSSGGWNATNTATGKRIRIKSAQRLRRPAKESGTTKKSGDAAKDAAKSTATKSAKPKAAKKSAGEAKPKRVSALDAAAQVLQSATKPMRAQELIEEMAAKGLWTSPGGKTPHATLYAAMTREIADKGKDARFAKVERGLFTFNGK